MGGGERYMMFLWFYCCILLIVSYVKKSSNYQWQKMTVLNLIDIVIVENWLKKLTFEMEFDF